MPELPEVETIVRGLNQMVAGLTIARVTHISPHLLDREPNLTELAGRTLVRFARRGKYIIAALDARHELLIHLRMTGRILIGEDVARQDQHDHLELTFRKSRQRLVFRDVRKFGVVQFVDRTQQEALERLGVEAPEIRTTCLAELLKGRKRPIKSLLLDQHLIAGLGNIYVDESLYRSGIHPLRSAHTLSIDETRLLAKAIRQVMKLAIRNLGTTFDSYSGVNGESGRFARYLRVYQRNGEQCGRCGDTIAKINVGGRGTHFCPTCQQRAARRRLIRS